MLKVLCTGSDCRYEFTFAGVSTDLASSTAPDEKAVITYVSSLYHHFSGLPKVRPLIESGQSEKKDEPLQTEEADMRITKMIQENSELMQVSRRSCLLR